MNIIFFAHPSFLGQQSMPRFARMLADGMSLRGHTVEILSPKPRFFNFHSNPFIKKWLGYIDQFVVFPRDVKRILKQWPDDTLFVFTDQALGPWVPPLANRHHVIHCHDFMAFQSAQGKIAENPTSWTGRQYQKLIRRGYARGKHFISVSKKTRDDLHQTLHKTPETSLVVYNGFHQPFHPEDPQHARNIFGRRINMDLQAGYLLHVGGNSWYKNRKGVLEIYHAWRSQSGFAFPLILVGTKPTQALVAQHQASPYAADIYWFSGIEDEYIQHAYAGALLFLFPSLGEGFGWPIAEAMASGCPVVTTDEAPMTEVAGNAGFLISRRPRDENKAQAWASEGAAMVEKILALAPDEHNQVVNRGIENAKRFDTEETLNQMEKIYQQIVSKGKVAVPT